LEAYESIQRILVPELRYSQTRYEEELGRILLPGHRWLDLGCGHRILPEWRADAEQALVARSGFVVGADLDFEALRRHRSIERRVYGDIARLPFADSTFDIATANMVLEHVVEPALHFREVARVLRPDGRFVFLTPNAEGYLVRAGRIVPEAAKGWLIRLLENRASEDVFRTYYRANSCASIHRFAAESGFAVEDLKLILTVPQFARILPLAILELLFIRLLTTSVAERLRPNILTVLRKLPDV
jgi:ubiquinone/menaquinone biosynthesis C-methylase UbiE